MADTANADTQPTSEVELRPANYWTSQPLPDDDADSAIGSDAESSTASLASSILAYREINGRTYHSDRFKATYWGANDDKQTETTDILHIAYTTLIDGKLHLAPLSDNIKKVLDLGTGSGIWAVEFADIYPNTEVIGTDLSPIQPAWVPPNLRFEIEDFTETWTFKPESFDYIHARWLLGCVKDWNDFAKQAFQALKPGGWFESYDFDAFTKSDDGTLTAKHAVSQWGQIFQEGMRKMGIDASFKVVAHQLQRKAFEAAGFTNIQERPVRCVYSGWSDNAAEKKAGGLACTALLYDMEGLLGLPASKLGWTTEEITVYASHVRREIKNENIHVYVPGLVVYGQKPL